MAEIKREGNTIRIGDKVLIEAGPARLTATATEALLANDQTAEHYHAPRPATEGEIADPMIATNDAGERVGIDAAGKHIAVGKKFDYLDYLGTPGFYIYEFGERPGYDPEKHAEREIWIERGFETDETVALNLALQIAG